MKPKNSSDKTEVVGTGMGEGEPFPTWPLTRLEDRGNGKEGGIDGTMPEVGHDVFLAHAFHHALVAVAKSNPDAAKAMQDAMIEVLRKLFTGQLKNVLADDYKKRTVHVSKKDTDDTLF